MELRVYDGLFLMRFFCLFGYVCVYTAVVARQRVNLSLDRDTYLAARSILAKLSGGPNISSLVDELLGNFVSTTGPAIDAAHIADGQASLMLLQSQFIEMMGAGANELGEIKRFVRTKSGGEVPEVVIGRQAKKAV